MTYQVVKPGMDQQEFVKIVEEVQTYRDRVSIVERVPDSALGVF